MRKIIAIVAALGLISGVYIFIASFLGLTMDKLGVRALLLHLGILALAIPLAFVDGRTKTADPFSGKPRWVVRSMQVLFILFVSQFFGFLALSHASSPEIINGDYVLNNHGKIVGYISQREYLVLKGWELRLFASGWIVVYCALMMYWWFPPQEPWTVVLPD